MPLKAPSWLKLTPTPFPLQEGYPDQLHRQVKRNQKSPFYDQMLMHLRTSLEKKGPGMEKIYPG